MEFETTAKDYRITKIDIDKCEIEFDVSQRIKDEIADKIVRFLLTPPTPDPYWEEDVENGTEG